ncbi:MAG: hypothetical protein PHV06_07495, partial [bacterium]|nr:hypothetical protein [bacterium]
DLGIRSSFADLGQTIAEIFQLPKLKNGTGFYREILPSLPEMSENIHGVEETIFVLDKTPGFFHETLELISKFSGDKNKLYLHSDIYNTNLQQELQDKLKKFEILDEGVKVPVSGVVVVPLISMTVLGELSSGILNSNISKFLQRSKETGLRVILGYSSEVEKDLPFELKNRHRQNLSELSKSGFDTFRFDNTAIELSRLLQRTEFRNKKSDSILTISDVKELIKDKKTDILTKKRLTPEARDYLKEKGYKL